MGSTFSSYARHAFELCNEFCTIVASGPLGILYVAYSGFLQQQFARTLLLSGVTVYSLFYVFQCDKLHRPNGNQIVFITGCDSGLGFSLAHYVSDLGFTVVATFIDLNSKGAQVLQSKKGVIPVKLDLKDDANITAVVKTVEAFLREGKRELWAVINNAGVMVFGEFEWQTENLIQEQMQVNLMGTLKLTNEFCPLLRRYKSRLITVTSHCALEVLPGLTIYGATKTALQGWSDGLRVEMKKYGVDVITFIPGSFIQSSNIMSKQNDYAHEMRANFTAEQNKFYGDYFKLYNLYLSGLSHANPPEKVPDPKLYEKFEKALLDLNPKKRYINEPFRYTIYHTLFKVMPTRVRDYLVQRFMAMPDYTPLEYVPEAAV